MNIDHNLVQLLRKSQRIVVLTGAGISKESGIPTFREAQTGLWAQYEPTELATPRAFQRNPKLIWEWYQWRRALVSQAKPNPGHTALVQMTQKTPRLTLITQNVDGLHQRAGSKNVVELHGNIMRTKCFNHNHLVEDWLEDDNVPPSCPICGGMLRPDVVWFGENLPPKALEMAIDAAQHADIFFSIGTSGIVEPAASLPHLARKAGAVLIEINPNQTPLTAFADFILTGLAGTILPDLVSQVWA
jgi:NAD-dependent deacetylase